jgi:hypothetical protein
MKISSIIKLPAVLMGEKIRRSLFRGEHGLRRFVNRVLRRTFGSKRDEVKGNGENYIMRRFVIKLHHQILFGCLNKEE